MSEMGTKASEMWNKIAKALTRDGVGCMVEEERVGWDGLYGTGLRRVGVWHESGARCVEWHGTGETMNLYRF